MSDAATTSYDQVPYESYPFFQTHPGRLATVATLLGLKPPPVTRCRVLELGCASGGNLLPMALTLPEGTFVGIDLSRREIGDGLKTVASLGLKNIRLEQRSILDVTADFGCFDYILCHGVFSWVPAPVQEKILEICKQNLASSGIAYVSYNTYPGWHMRGMIRDMMQYHAEQFRDPVLKVKQARNLLDFLTKSVAQENTPYSALLKSEAESIRQSQDSYLFHEHLEDVNEPLYFHQFVKRAEAKGLRYLAEVDLRVMVPGNYPPEVESVLQMMSPDLLHLEQYMDFLRNRTFRQTLLCHQHVTPNYALRGEQLAAFHVASLARPVSARPDIHSTEFEQFRAADGITLNSREPIVKAAMVHLSETWPQIISFGELLKAARSRLSSGGKPEPKAPAADTQGLGEALLKCYTSASSLVELYLHPPRFTLMAGEYPVASPLARYQAAGGPRVTSLRHELVTLGDFERHVLRHLDGSRNRAALVEVLAALVEQGELSLQQDGPALIDAQTLRSHLARSIDELLPKLARHALLQA